MLPYARRPCCVPAEVTPPTVIFRCWWPTHRTAFLPAKGGPQRDQRASLTGAPQHGAEVKTTARPRTEGLLEGCSLAAGAIRSAASRKQGLRASRAAPRGATKKRPGRHLKERGAQPGTTGAVRAVRGGSHSLHNPQTRLARQGNGKAVTSAQGCGEPRQGAASRRGGDRGCGGPPARTELGRRREAPTAGA